MVVFHHRLLSTWYIKGMNRGALSYRTDDRWQRIPQDANGDDL